MIFLDNKYTKIYFALIKNRQNEKIIKEECYCETHHIIPKSLGGDNTITNLVNLSPREHFIAHLLLTKMTAGEENIKMNWALHRMAFSGIQYFGSRDYEWFRKRHSQFLSENHPSKTQSWCDAVSEKVSNDWKNNDVRRQKTSERMKLSWKEGKIKPKDQTGEKNHMWGKRSWNNGKTYKNEKLKGSKNGTAITVILQDQTGKTFSFPCLKEACAALNLNYACMLQVSRGKNKQHKGYIMISKTSTQNKKEGSQNG